MTFSMLWLSIATGLNCYFIALFWWTLTKMVEIQIRNECNSMVKIFEKKIFAFANPDSSNENFNFPIEFEDLGYRLLCSGL